MTINLYGIIVLTGLAAGFISASFLSHISGLKRQSIYLTIMLNFFCTVIFSVMSVIIFSGGRQYGLSGLGGAFGLMTGTLISIFIHNDHPFEMLSSWVVSAPLMYGIAKLGCLYSGCCPGSFMGLPVQLVVSLSFIAVYILSVTVFVRSKDKAAATWTAMTVSFAVRIALDFFHDSHAGKIITREQILVIVAGSITLILFAFRKKLPVLKGE